MKILYRYFQYALFSVMCDFILKLAGNGHDLHINNTGLSLFGMKLTGNLNPETNHSGHTCNVVHI